MKINWLVGLVECWNFVYKNDIFLVEECVDVCIKLLI